MLDKTVAILAAKRTPIGAFQGKLKDFSAVQLGAKAIQGCLETSGIHPDHISDVIMGCVLPAGLGQAPARQALIQAGLAQGVHGLTINKVCGSGMKAIMLAHDQIKVGSAQAVIAGGMESMTNAPYLLTRGREGYRMGHSLMYDHMLLDGLEDAYERGSSMGVFAEKTVDKCGFNRQQQDEFSIRSAEKALLAARNNYFASEIVPLTLKGKGGEEIIHKDEPPTRVKFDKIPSLRPAFKEGGTVTAASSSSIADGAAALALMDGAQAVQQGYRPLAYIRGHASHAQEPEWFTLAPIGAIQKLLQQLDWPLDTVDLFEINEAFAVVTMATLSTLKIDPAKVNIHGGACALGHPIGASGARIVTTLIHALKTHHKKRGIASLCIGGGEATALAIELA